MKILYLQWNSFGGDDIILALRSLGHEVFPFSHPEYNSRDNREFLAYTEQKLEEVKPDCVFSSNYYSLVSRACDPHGIPYISWVYDAPQLFLYSTAVLLPCNYIFVFDRRTYENFHRSGINTFYYMPLGAPVRRYDSMEVTSQVHASYDCDISFVGALYNEKHNYYNKLVEKLDSYTRSYLEGLMEAQLKISGDNFIEDCLTEPIVQKLQEATPYAPCYDGAETDAYVYAHYFINRKLTELDRTRTLAALSEQEKVVLYTFNPTPGLPKVINRGPLDYVVSMPYAFKCSKINLNITLRSITTGIPLRAFDIMGAGGFLMTNYQADFLDYFIPDEDFVYYESTEDLIDKCHYYLAHETERARIARSGYEKVKAHHSYEVRLKEIFDIVFHS